MRRRCALQRAALPLLDAWMRGGQRTVVSPPARSRSAGAAVRRPVRRRRGGGGVGGRWGEGGVGGDSEWTLATARADARRLRQRRDWRSAVRSAAAAGDSACGEQEGALGSGAPTRSAARSRGVRRMLRFGAGVVARVDAQQLPPQRKASTDPQRSLRPSVRRSLSLPATGAVALSVRHVHDVRCDAESML